MTEIRKAWDGSEINNTSFVISHMIATMAQIAPQFYKAGGFRTNLNNLVKTLKGRLDGRSARLHGVDVMAEAIAVMEDDVHPSDIVMLCAAMEQLSVDEQRKKIADSN